MIEKGKKGKQNTIFVFNEYVCMKVFIKRKKKKFELVLQTVGK